MVEKTKKWKVSSIRWTAEEHAFLKEKEKAWGKSISSIVRMSIRMALGIPTKEEANIRQFQEIERTLLGLATNFNQLTRAANAGKVMWTQTDAKLVSDLSEAVRETRALLHEYERMANRRGLDRAVMEQSS